MADDTERHVGPGDQAVPPLRRFCEGLVAAGADAVDEDTGPRTDAVTPGWTRAGREPGSGSGGCSGSYPARIAEAPGSQRRHPWRSGGAPVASMEPVDQDARGAVRFSLPPGATKDRRTPAGRGPSDEGFLKQLAVLLFPRRGTQAARAEKARVLERISDDSGWKPAEATVSTGFDPPISLSFLRRNEVAIRLPAP